MPIFSPIAWLWWLGTSESTRPPPGSSQRVQELGAAKRLVQHLRLQRARIVVQDVVGPQQHVDRRAPRPARRARWPCSAPSSMRDACASSSTVPGRNTPWPTKSATKRVARLVIEVVRRVPLLDAPLRT